MWGARRVGIGLRPEIAPDLLGDRRAVDFVEVVAETCFTQRSTRREAHAVAEIWPVVPHGVKLSLGSAEGIDLDRARRLGELARELRAPVISEHVSFTRAGGYDIGHLTQLPRTRAAIAAVARNVARARTVFPDVPLLLENVAWSVLWPPSDDDALDEGAFHCDIVEATGCDLLLDAGNLYANALNEGRDPAAVLAGYPLDRIGMVHVAGGVMEHGFYYDTHAHAVPDGVFDLVARILAVRPDVPVMIERDADLSFAGLSGELGRLRALPRPTLAQGSLASYPLAQGSSHSHAVATVGQGSLGAPAQGSSASLAITTTVRQGSLTSGAGTPAQGSSASLEAAQGALAAALVGPSPALPDSSGRTEPAKPDPALAGIPARSIARARDILQRKRIDDALPLLGQLSRSGERTREIAARVLAQQERPRTGAGPSDAWRIAEAALRDPELGDDAAIDHLVLRARFVGSRAGLRPRRTPFIGYARLGDGRRVRATKGFGALAEVMLRRER